MDNMDAEAWGSNTRGQGRDELGKNRPQLPFSEVLNLLNQQKKILADLLEVALNEIEVKKCKNRLEAVAVRLIRNYLVSDGRENKIDAIFEEGRLMEKVTDAKTDKEAMALINEFKEKCESMENDFLSSLTDEVVRSNDIFVAHVEEMNAIFADFEFGTGTNSVAQREGTVETGTSRGEKEFIPVTDPVTQDFLIDPVQNKICNHVYGKASILQLIHNNNRARCPYPGCSSTQFVIEKNLTHNIELAKKIAAKVNEAQKRKDSTGLSQMRQRKSERLEDLVDEPD